MKEGFIAFFKIFLFALFLPLIIAVTLSFQTHLLGLPVEKEVWLLWGAGSYVLANFFLYNFKDVYLWGQGLTAKIFSFFQPAVTVASLVVPIYTVSIIIIYVVLMIMGKAYFYEKIFLFLVGFTLAMNLIMAAHQMHEEDKGPLKAQYFIGFSALYFVSLCLMALLLAWVIPEFSLIAFGKSLVYHTTHLYKEAYRLFFVG
jgi:hypothetical protein